MTRINFEVLAKLAIVVREALAEGDVTPDQVKYFSDQVFEAALEEQVKRGHPQGPTSNPRGKKEKDDVKEKSKR